MSNPRWDVRCVSLLVVGWFSWPFNSFGQLPPSTPGEVRWLEGHAKPIYSVAHSPDGKFLYSASFDHTVKLWDRQTNQVLRTLTDHTNGVLAVAVAKQAPLFATAGMDRQVLLYDVPAREPVANGGLGGEGVTVVSSPDGTLLITADKGPLLRLWNGLTGQHLRDFPGLTAPVTGTALTMDLKQVMASTADGFVRAWDVQQGKLLGSLTVPSTASLDVSGDSQQVATLGTDGILRISRLPASPTKVLNGHSQPLTGLVISDDGKQAVTASTDQTVRYFDLTQSREIRAYPGQVGPALSLAVSRAFDQLATGNPSGQVKFWKLDGTDLRSVAGHTGNVLALAYHPDGKLIASAGQDGTIRIWQMPPLEHKSLPGHTQPVQAVAVSPSGKLIATVADKLVEVFDSQGKLLMQLTGATQPLTSAAFAQEEHMVVAGDSAGGIRAWTVADGKPQGEVAAHAGQITAVVAHANAKLVVSSGADGSVKFWQLPLPAPDPSKNQPASPAQFIAAHPARTTGLALSPNGDFVLSSGDDKVLKLWDGSGKPVRQYLGSHTPLRRLAIRPDTKQIAAGSDASQGDKGLYFWNFESAELIRRIETPAPVTGVAYSTDGSVVATSHTDRRLRIYGASDGLLWEEIATPQVPQNVVFLDARTLLSGQSDNQARLFGVSIHRVWPAHQGQINTLTYSANGAVLMSGGVDKALRVWDAATGREVATLNGCNEAVTSAMFSSDQKEAVASSLDKHVRIWTLPPINPQGAPIAASPATVQPLATALHSVALSPDSNSIATAGDDSQIHVWDRASGLELERFVGHTAAVTRLRFSSDGQMLVSGANDNTCRIWQATTRTLQKAHQGTTALVKLAPTGDFTITAGDDGKVIRWNLPDLKQEREFAGSSGPLRSLAISADGQFVAAGGDDKHLRIWKTSDGQAVSAHSTPSAVTSLRWSPSGSKIAVGGADNILRTYAVTETAGMRRITWIQEGQGHSAAVSSSAFTADERLLFSVSADRTWKRWMSVRSTPAAKLNGHSAQVYALDFSPDGKQLASASGDKTVGIWNTATGELIAKCSGHTGQVFSVSFSANGQTIASAGADKTIRIWKSDGTGVKEIKDGDEDGIYSVQYYADPNYVLVGGLSKTWQFWNVTEPKVHRTATGHTDHIYRAIFNPNWNRVASVDYSGHLFVSDMGSGTPLHHQQLPVSAAYSLSYSPDGKELAIGTQDSRLILLTIPPPGQ